MPPFAIMSLANQRKRRPFSGRLGRCGNRLPLEVHRQVFTWVLRLLEEKKLVKGKTVGVDSTTLEANAAAHNIWVLMRKLFQMGTPRGLQEYVDDLGRAARAVYLVCLATWQKFAAPALYQPQQNPLAAANRFNTAA